MSSRQRLFRAFYRLGFTPWDGHPLATSLRELVEGDDALPPGTVLDIGCGTGDNALYLAGLGWDVTGVDYVANAVQKARAKAAKRADSAPGAVRFDQADATRLTGQGIGADFALIVDSGCLHGMSANDRDAYVGEVTAVAAPDARLLIVAFVPDTSFGVPGIDPAEVQRRFALGWTLLDSGDEPGLDDNGKNPARYYLFARRRT
ncbi:class I SAM-dependent methyltransferase [Mycolicibacterium llatzerense]|uniref:class I SAM-dependent methyltransferase n=1 Tax=Mycolicibacterium llatzerense TaxID=280871 RepID=UPI0021B54175|nr:class I SAM-dependent methyltransferase [Mycolicibacterium llatzerense]MCT7361742.1 methyltransferase type 12 [Mycolicibacterium llatzerense]MCT7369082.1 methyltransferase type 12 [Mycolicibacterium llatzerense]